MDKNANFGLPQTAEEQIAALKAQLAEANAKLITAGIADADAPPGEGTGPVDAQGFPEDYVRVEIFQGRDKQDLSYVPLGIGGYVLKVTRGREVIIPSVFVTECLEHAIEEITMQSEGGLVTRPALRFPYQVRGKATKEEFLAQQAEFRATSQGARVGA